MTTPIPALARRELLTWARRRANLEVVAAERKIGLPAGRLVEWESGLVAPTITELRQAAKVYRRPLAAFYLPAPPDDFETLRDYRRVTSASGSSWSGALEAEHRRAVFQRETVLDILELDGTIATTAWRVDGLPDGNEPIAVAARQRLEDVAPRSYPSSSGSPYDHLNYWTAAVEEAGVLVMTTERGGVEVGEMRAFSLYHDEVPVIVLNGADVARGRLFSLLHEYAHLLLHTSGICDTRTDRDASTPDRRLEARCNAIAAAIAMPRDLVLLAPTVREHDRAQPWTVAELAEAAGAFGVSVEAFLRRLVTLGRATLDAYRDYRANLTPQVPAKPSGGNFYVTKSRDLGRGYIRTVVDAHQRALVDAHSAATFLDVKVGQIQRLAHAARL